MGGDFIWTLTSVDIASGWTELRATWNRGQHACFRALESIWESQPFVLLGVDSDNGGEFLNYHLYNCLKKNGICQTRSRPYYKNDQAYVEQKNHTHVRELLGHERLEHVELLDALNANLSTAYILKEEFRLIYQDSFTEKTARRRIKRWCRTVQASGIEALERFARGIERDLKEVLAFFRHRLTSGKIEAFNNQIARLIHRSCGMTNLHHLFLKMRAQSYQQI